MSCRRAGRAGGGGGRLSEVAWIEVTTVGLLVRVAESLCSSDSGVVGNAVLVGLLTNEGINGLGVVLETRSRVVGRAGTAENQSIRFTGVIAGRTTAKSSAGVLLTLAPLTSDGRTEGIDVDGAVGGLSGNSSDEERNGDDRFGKHFEGLRTDWRSLTVTSDSIDVLRR